MLKKTTNHCKIHSPGLKFKMQSIINILIFLFRFILISFIFNIIFLNHHYGLLTHSIGSIGSEKLKECLFDKICLS